MAPRFSTLAWKIPWTEEPGRLQSMGSLRVGHNWATSLSLFTFMHWRRKWQPTPVFLPWESQGWGSLVGCCLWGHTESDMTEVTWQQQWSPCLHAFPTEVRRKIWTQFSWRLREEPTKQRAGGKFIFAVETHRLKRQDFLYGGLKYWGIPEYVKGITLF